MDERALTHPPTLTLHSLTCPPAHPLAHPSATLRVGTIVHTQTHPDADSSRKASLSTAIFHTWNATIGVGILAMPRAFALVGWATGSAMLVVFGL